MDNDHELEKYSRQIILNEVGPEGQQKLKKASVLIIGIGGLGSSVIQYLNACLLYTSPSPRDKRQSRMPSSA